MFRSYLSLTLLTHTNSFHPTTPPSYPSTNLFHIHPHNLWYQHLDRLTQGRKWVRDSDWKTGWEPLKIDFGREMKRRLWDINWVMDINRLEYVHEWTSVPLLNEGSYMKRLWLFLDCFLHAISNSFLFYSVCFYFIIFYSIILYYILFYVQTIVSAGRVGNIVNVFWWSEFLTTSAHTAGVFQVISWLCGVNGDFIDKREIFQIKCEFRWILIL